MAGNEDTPRLSAEEYAEWIGPRLQSVADDLSERFAHVLPDGVRFAWEAADAP